MTKISVIIRDATDRDIKAIARIYEHYVTRTSSSFEEIAPDAGEMLERLQKTMNMGLPYLVADQDGEILGYSYAGPFRLRSAYRYTIEDSIYVAPNVARRGIGTVLLDELVSRCKNMGYRQMIAMIGDSGNLASINLHRKTGFRQEGVLRGVGLKFGRWIDVVIMHRELAGQDTMLPDL